MSKDSQEQQKRNPEVKRPRGRPKKNSSDKNEKRNQDIGEPPIVVIEEGDDMIFDRIGKKKQEEAPIRAPMQRVEVGGRASGMAGMEPPLPPQPTTETTRESPAQIPPPPPQAQEEKIGPELKWYLENCHGTFTPQEFVGEASVCNLLYAVYCMQFHTENILQEILEEAKKR